MIILNNDIYKYDFSIFFPTRGRVDRLKKSIASIYNNADLTLNNFEVVVKIDFDDESTLNELSYFQNYKNLKFIVSSRLGGWLNMKDFVNDVCAASTGKYLFGFNDDVQILTKNWNSILKTQVNQHKIYFPKVNGYGEAFIIIPQDFFRALNCEISPHNQIDTYIFNIAKQLNIGEYVNCIELFHESVDYVPDETLRDKTWFEKMEHCKYNSNLRDSYGNSERFTKDCATLKLVLENI